ncbi:hypothetical protein [Terriglobus albidus]|uniref:hypothetical protein n=1 Tax=Terriglobus albidus TaxID=1592106 RepID=UPI0021DF96CC|nr:hypothetical protein [Terriglobus albidus]
MEDVQWPELQQDDRELLKTLMKVLSARVSGDPYSRDGSYSALLAELPPGLRAMEATHWLDISLTLDSVTWHFGNFGEPGLVAQTEEGLLELGLPELAACFHEAAEFMTPLLHQRISSEEDLYQLLERKGLRGVSKEIDRRAWALDLPGRGTSRRRGRSLIYEAWVRYARAYPERVFGS